MQFIKGYKIFNNWVTKDRRAGRQINNTHTCTHRQTDTHANTQSIVICLHIHTTLNGGHLVRSVY